MASFINFSVIPPMYRQLFRWLAAYSGTDFNENPPKFENGIRIGDTVLDEEKLSKLLNLLEENQEKEEFSGRRRKKHLDI